MYRPHAKGILAIVTNSWPVLDLAPSRAKGTWHEDLTMLLNCLYTPFDQPHIADHRAARSAAGNGGGLQRRNTPLLSLLGE